MELQILPAVPAAWGCPGKLCAPAERYNGGVQARQASAALPAAKAAAAAAAAAPALQPQRGSDAGLQVDFEEDIDAEELVAAPVQPKQDRAGKVLPRAAQAGEALQRPKLKVRSASAQLA